MTLWWRTGSAPAEPDRPGDDDQFRAWVEDVKQERHRARKRALKHQHAAKPKHGRKHGLRRRVREDRTRGAAGQA